MKSLLLDLLQFALRKLLSANAGQWASLKICVRELDALGGTAESKHETLDVWLKTHAPAYLTPAIRRRLIQAAVLCVRIEEITAKL